MKLQPATMGYVDPDAISKATIEPGVVGILICPACGRTNLEVNGRFGKTGCFLGHPLTMYLRYVAVPLDAELEAELPESWKPFRFDAVEIEANTDA